MASSTSNRWVIFFGLLVILLCSPSAVAFVPSSTPKNAAVDRSMSSAVDREIVVPADVPRMDAAVTVSNEYVRNDWVYLPASASRLSRNHDLQLLEQTIGRLAMAGAIGIVWKEMAFGQSIVEQMTQMMQ